MKAGSYAEGAEVMAYCETKCRKRTRHRVVKDKPNETFIHTECLVCQFSQTPSRRSARPIKDAKNLITRVTKFQTDDGKVHDTEGAARTHLHRRDIVNWLQEYGIQQGVEAHVLAEDMLAVFTITPRKKS